MTSILSGEVRKNLMMSRFELSETVRMRVARRVAYAIDARAYPRAKRFGRYWGNIKWMQS